MTVPLVALTVVFISALPVTADDGPDELLTKAEQALRERRFQEAEQLATEALTRKPDLSGAYVLRGRARRQLGKADAAMADFNKAIALQPSAAAHLYRGEARSALDQHGDAIADFGRALELDPKAVAAYHLRGRERFKAGQIAASIADFDRFIERQPEHENECWERGLSRYYAGQFAAAQKSFEDYHKVGPEDIENGLWRMLSQAEFVGLPAAQKALFRYEPKRRPPFPLLYDLYSGKTSPAEVLAHGNDGAANQADRQTRTFYAHLYVGLWHVVNRDHTEATRHIDQAVSLRSSDYMWYVAREQLRRLKANR